MKGRDPKRYFSLDIFLGTVVAVSVIFLAVLSGYNLLNYFTKNTVSVQAKSTQIKHAIVATIVPSREITKIPSIVPTKVSKVIPSITQSTVASLNNGFCVTVPVLFYHHVEPLDIAKQAGHVSLTVDAGFFEQQMQYLKDHGYRTLSAEELVDDLRSHTSPGKAVVVTLDDGYSDVFTNAYPIAKKYNIVLNLMISAGLLDNPGYLSWDNLKEMVGSGMVFAYDHTWSHYSLPRGDENKDKMEIMTAKTQLEQQLGKAVRIFTYPYGSNSETVVNLLRQEGFTGAFTTIPSFAQCEGFIYYLHRNRIGNAQLSAYGL